MQHAHAVRAWWPLHACAAVAAGACMCTPLHATIFPLRLFPSPAHACLRAGLPGGCLYIGFDSTLAEVVTAVTLGREEMAANRSSVLMWPAASCRAMSAAALVGACWLACWLASLAPELKWPASAPCCASPGSCSMLAHAPATSPAHAQSPSNHATLAKPVGSKATY